MNTFKNTTLSSRRSHRRTWMWPLVLVVGLAVVVTGLWFVLASSGFALTLNDTHLAAAPTATAAAIPPGTRWYYERSQWQPLDQQP